MARSVSVGGTRALTLKLRNRVAGNTDRGTEMFEGMDPEQQRRDAQWQEVSRMFKGAMWLSAAIALVAEVLHRLQAVERLLADDLVVDARAWVYAGLMYLVSVPVLFVRMRRALSGYKPPRNSVSTRIFAMVFGAVSCTGMILLPVIVIRLGPDAAARGHSIYQLFSGSVFGTAVVGGIMGYGAAMAAWMLFCGLPKVVFR